MLHDSKFILISKQPYNIRSHISDFMSRPRDDCVGTVGK